MEELVSSHPSLICSTTHQQQGRVKGYFDKLKSAETKDTRSFLSAIQNSRLTSFVAKFKIDKAAANRFISAAIASGSSAGKAMNSQPATHVRFDEADKLLKDTVEDEDEMEVEVVAEGKEIEAPQGTGKKSLSRPKMDPFTGTLPLPTLLRSRLVQGTTLRPLRRARSPSGTTSESGRQKSSSPRPKSSPASHPARPRRPRRQLARRRSATSRILLVLHVLKPHSCYAIAH